MGGVVKVESQHTLTSSWSLTSERVLIIKSFLKRSDSFLECCSISAICNKSFRITAWYIWMDNFAKGPSRRNFFHSFTPTVRYEFVEIRLQHFFVHSLVRRPLFLIRGCCRTRRYSLGLVLHALDGSPDTSAISS